jgi:hypothetical protein
MRLAADQVAPVRRGITITPRAGLPVVATARRSRESSAARAA